MNLNIWLARTKNQILMQQSTYFFCSDDLCKAVLPECMGVGFFPIQNRWTITLFKLLYLGTNIWRLLQGLYYKLFWVFKPSSFLVWLDSELWYDSPPCSAGEVNKILLALWCLEKIVWRLFQGNCERIIQLNQVNPLQIWCVN